jgi:hypothetical protein
MENGCVEAQNVVFERPDIGMKNHLKALFIRAKVNNVGVNKILVDGGVVVNIMGIHPPPSTRILLTPTLFTLALIN